MQCHIETAKQQMPKTMESESMYESEGNVMKAPPPSEPWSRHRLQDGTPVAPQASAKAVSSPLGRLVAVLCRASPGLAIFRRLPGDPGRNVTRCRVVPAADRGCGGWRASELVDKRPIRGGRGVEFQQYGA